MLYPFAAVLGHEGIAEGTLLTAASIPEPLYRDPGARVSYELGGRFLKAAVARTKYLALGLEAAKYLDTAQFQLFEFFAASSPRVETAIDDLVRYQHVLTNSGALKVESRREGVVLRYAPPVAAPRVVVEYVLGGLLLSAIRSLKGVKVPRRVDDPGVLSVCFACRVPAAARREYERFFGPRVQYDASYNGILISRELSRHKNARANPNAHEVLETEIRQQAQAGAQVHACSDRVRALIAEGLGGGGLCQDRVARALHMSRTTLKRRLAAEGTHLRALFAEVRKEVALCALRDPKLSVREVAARAGYEDATAFNRAFKRWTGASPVEYRARKPR